MDADDVITKEEQIFLLLKAKAKCERHLKAKVPKVYGECSHSNPRLHGWGWTPLCSTLSQVRMWGRSCSTRCWKAKLSQPLSLAPEHQMPRGQEDARVMVMGLQSSSLYPKPRQSMGDSINHQFSQDPLHYHQWYGKQRILPTPLLCFPLTYSLYILPKWVQA